MDDAFLTIEVLESILREFDWPEPYRLEDELPDGIAMVFPRCTLFWVEGVDAIAIHFLAEQTHFDSTLTHKHALRAVRSKLEPAGAPVEPVLIQDIASPPSTTRVKNNIRDLCTLVLTYLRPTLAGDFSWVETAKRYFQSS